MDNNPMVNRNTDSRECKVVDILRNNKVACIMANNRCSRSMSSNSQKEVAACVRA